MYVLLQAVVTDCRSPAAPFRGLGREAVCFGV